jgi:hypothetical protein
MSARIIYAIYINDEINDLRPRIIFLNITPDPIEELCELFSEMNLDIEPMEIDTT